MNLIVVLILTIVFFIGASIASFINLLVDRLHKKKKFIFTRSECDHCGKTLKWWHLIPIINFLILKGKCAYCSKKLSNNYFIVEGLLGIIFLLTFLSNFQILLDNNVLYFILKILFELIIISIFFFIGLYDYKYYIISNKSIILGLIFTLIYYVLLYILGQTNDINQLDFISNHLISAIILFVFFLLILVFTKGKGMGGGDVKLSFLIGLVLGVKSSIIALYGAFISGAVVSIILVSLKIKGTKDKIPFGPFLAFGFIVAILYGEIISNFFLGDIFRYMELVLGIKII